MLLRLFPAVLNCDMPMASLYLDKDDDVKCILILIPCGLLQAIYSVRPVRQSEPPLRPMSLFPCGPGARPRRSSAVHASAGRRRHDAARGCRVAVLRARWVVRELTATRCAWPRVTRSCALISRRTSTELSDQKLPPVRDVSPTVLAWIAQAGISGYGLFDDDDVTFRLRDRIESE